MGEAARPGGWAPAGERWGSGSEGLDWAGGTLRRTDIKYIRNKRNRDSRHGC